MMTFRNLVTRVFIFAIPILLLTSCDLLGGRNKGVVITRCSGEEIDSARGEGWSGQVAGDLMTLSFDRIKHLHVTLVLRDRENQLPEFVRYEEKTDTGATIFEMKKGKICISKWDLHGVITGRIVDKGILINNGFALFWVDLETQTGGKL